MKLSGTHIYNVHVIGQKSNVYIKRTVIALVNVLIIQKLAFFKNNESYTQSNLICTALVYNIDKNITCIQILTLENQIIKTYYCATIYQMYRT